MNKQTVYIPTENYDTFSISYKNEEGSYAFVEQKEGYFSTEEELKQLLQDYTDRIVENAKIDWGLIHAKGVDKDSIKNQLEPFLKEIL